MTLSYDAVFLYMLLSSLYEPEETERAGALSASSHERT